MENRFKGLYCRDCHAPYVPDNRHVGPNDERVRDCIPGDNLLMLELELEKRERIKSETKRS